MLPVVVVACAGSSSACSSDASVDAGPIVPCGAGAQGARCENEGDDCVVSCTPPTGAGLYCAQGRWRSEAIVCEPGYPFPKGDAGAESGDATPPDADDAADGG
jgi:hypothetical protein